MLSCLSIAFAILIGNSMVLASGTNLYGIDIELEGTRQYKAFALTPEIINHAGTSALRVMEREGEEVPFFIHSSAYEEGAQEVYTTFVFLRQFERGQHYYLDFEVITPPNIDPLISHLQLESPQSEYLKYITVLGSYDDQNWTEITTSLVYAVSDVSQNEVNLGGVHRYNFYRLRIPTPQERVDFYANGLYRYEWEARIPFIAEVEAVFDVESADGITTVTLHGLDGYRATMENLRITGIRIETDSNFKRSVRTDHGETTLYRLFFQNTELTNTFILYPGHPQPLQISFAVIDHDDRPIDINQIKVEYAVEYVVFRAEEGREYILHYGGDLTRPRYDIENFRDLIIQEGFDLVTLQGPSVLIEGVVSEQDYSWLFNIVIMVAGVLLTIVAVSAFIKRR